MSPVKDPQEASDRTAQERQQLEELDRQRTARDQATLDAINAAESAREAERMRRTFDPDGGRR